jgi:hypothetical protein
MNVDKAFVLFICIRWLSSYWLLTYLCYLYMVVPFTFGNWVWNNIFIFQIPFQHSLKNYWILAINMVTSLANFFYSKPLTQWDLLQYFHKNNSQKWKNILKLFMKLSKNDITNLCLSHSQVINVDTTPKKTKGPQQVTKLFYHHYLSMKLVSC